MGSNPTPSAKISTKSNSFRAFWAILRTIKRTMLVKSPQLDIEARVAALLPKQKILWSAPHYLRWRTTTGKVHRGGAGVRGVLRPNVHFFRRLLDHAQNDEESDFNQ